MEDILEYAVEVPIINHLIFVAAGVAIRDVADNTVVADKPIVFGPFVLTKFDFLAAMGEYAGFLYVASAQVELLPKTHDGKVPEIVPDNTFMLNCDEEVIDESMKSVKELSSYYHFFVHKKEIMKVDNFDTTSRVWAMTEEHVSDLEDVNSSRLKSLYPLFDKVAKTMPHTAGLYFKSMVPVLHKLKRKINQYFVDHSENRPASILEFSRKIYGSLQFSDCTVSLVDSMAKADSKEINSTILDSKALSLPREGVTWRLNKLILAANSLYFQKRILMANSAFAEKSRPDLFLLEGSAPHLYEILWRHMYGQDISDRIRKLMDNGEIMEFVKIIQFLQIPALSEYFDLDIQEPQKHKTK
jgi:hypothetical protein